MQAVSPGARESGRSPSVRNTERSAVRSLPDRERVRRRLDGVVLIVSGGELGGQLDDAGPVQVVEPCGPSGCDEEEVNG